MRLRSGKIIESPDTDEVVLIQHTQGESKEKRSEDSKKFTKKEMKKVLENKTKAEVLDFAYSLPSLALKNLKHRTKKNIIQNILTGHKPKYISPKKAKLMYTEISKPLSKVLPYDVSDLISTLADNLKKEEDLLNFMKQTFKEYTKKSIDYTIITRGIRRYVKNELFVKIFNIDYLYLLHHHFKLVAMEKVNKKTLNEKIPIIHHFITENMAPPFTLFSIILYSLSLLYESIVVVHKRRNKHERDHIHYPIEIRRHIEKIIRDIRIFNILFKKLERYNITLQTSIVNVLNKNITEINKNLPNEMKITNFININPRMAYSSPRSLNNPSRLSRKKALSL